MIAWVTERLNQRNIFYGWLIVAVGLLAGFATGAVWNPTVSVFIKPVSEEFGWSRAMVSGAITVGAISGGLLGAVLGPVIDKRGPRLVLTVATIVMGAFLVALSQTENIVHFYLYFGIARMIATGAITLTVSVAIANWFVSKRGRAMAITLLGERGGSASLPLLSQYLVLTKGWRVGWLSLGLLVWAFAVVPCALFLRRRPEDVGLRPDGQPEQPSAEPEESASEPAWTTKEALKTRAFWLISLACSQVFMVIGGVHLHQFSHMTDVGISPAVAVGAVSLIQVVAAVASLLWGMLSERLPVRYCLFFVFLGLAAGVGLLMAVKSAAMAYAYAVLWGLSLGGVSVLIQLIWPRYYGRLSLGAIRGMAWPVLMMANSVGPLIAGGIYDTAGSYQYAFIIFAIAAVLAAVWMLLVKTPQHPGVSEKN